MTLAPPERRKRHVSKCIGSSFRLGAAAQRLRRRTAAYTAGKGHAGNGHGRTVPGYVRRGGYVYGHHGKCHLSGRRLLLGHGAAHAIHPRRHRRPKRLRQRHLRGGCHLPDRLQGRHRLPGDCAGGIRPRAGESRRAAAGLLLCDRPHGAEPAGQRPGQPVSDRRVLHQRQGQGNGGAHRGHRAGPQREILCGARPAEELLSRRGISPKPLRKEPQQLLPHPPGGDGAVLQAAHRSGRLPEARGGDHS